MNSNCGLFNRKLLWIVCGSLPLSVFGQTVARVEPVPRDPLELATNPVQPATTSAAREAPLQLLTRARGNFAFRSTGQAYDLKVNFTVDGRGETDYDGAWQMEDQFVPRLGHRWTATAESGYTTTQLATAGKIYWDGTANAVPLRLLQARGALFDPIQSADYANRGTIRTFQATVRGVAVTCLLLSRAQNPANLAAGRDWEETEECIDPQSGLLQVHSEVPGLYALYDYTDAPQFAGHTLPHSVTITEAGRTVSTVVIESIGTTPVDASLFVPTDAMKANGPAVEMTSATKVTRVPGQVSPATGATVRPVCVFGMVTSTGRLVEAHTLQPSDANSQAAVEDARAIDFTPLTPAGAAPRQHFVFVVEKFVTQQ